jgi:hypothetical protein
MDELKDLYLVQNRINIFYLSEFSEPANAIAFTSVGGIVSQASPAIWIKKGQNPLIHEMGGFWGLLKTFENTGTENVDGSNCSTSGDNVCDTPADPYVTGDNMLSYIKNCVFISEKKDSKNMFYTPDLHNYMSYYNCDCSKFTNGQYVKMYNTYMQDPTKW